MNNVREDGRITCYKIGCKRVIPKTAKVPYTCKCGRRHLFLAMWECCGKYMSSDTRKGDDCPHCHPAVPQLTAGDELYWGIARRE